MTEPIFTDIPVPEHRIVNRQKAPNPYVGKLAALIDGMAADAKGVMRATGGSSFVVEGDADRRTNPAVRIACRKLDEAGRELGYTVRKEVVADEKGAAINFYPVGKVTRTRKDKSESTSPASVETATEPAETVAEAPAEVSAPVTSRKSTKGAPKLDEAGYAQL